MNVDRSYILLGQFNRKARTGGSDFYDIDLREIMGGLYDKYNRFNLKLEAWASRTANSSATTDDILFLQVGGLHWLSGYDTNPLYQGSRIVASMFFNENQGAYGEFYRGMIYPSNIATQTFSREACSNVTLELFATHARENNKMANLFSGDNPAYLFSITGVDEKYPIYRISDINVKTGQLVLNASQATNLEVNRRAISWNVDLSQIIDRDIYTNYSKFAFITKLIRTNTFNGTGTDNFYAVLLMSGLSWYSPSLKLNSTYTGSTNSFIYHNGTCNAIGVTSDSTIATADVSRETFIDSIFYKPASPVVNLVLTFNNITTLNLISVTAPVNPFVFIFNIVPVE